MDLQIGPGFLRSQSVARGRASIGSSPYEIRDVAEIEIEIFLSFRNLESSPHALEEMDK